MLPPNIDLTEYGVFGGHATGAFMDTSVDLDYDEETLMTNDEHEYLVWWESIFGRKRQPNARGTLFPKPGYDTPLLPRIPWHEYYYEDSFNIPAIEVFMTWNEQAVERDTNYNLFNLR